ncbi:general secretion pathway protein GspL [Comamonas sp. Y33R10-2]|uniref:type II secretion system protein GspL n=1 Tax=Comamonas sp. Y33R10-2 TaxID=2853257 RepID=UPI001C5CBA2A|nr:type II secretion system protein GspL [Comamonas sp. Y33R10-2]QXZ09828.1 general secretion pathway protein GspL [Comamonas sp. Y33R10-2]
MSTLLIKLPSSRASSATKYLYAVSDDGQSAQNSDKVRASQLPALGRTGQTTAVIPARRLSWHCVELPPGLNVQSRRQQPRVRAALEGLLEEKLLDDVSTLHIALDSSPADNTYWIAVCDKQWLQSHLQWLEHNGHAANRLVPEQWPSANARLQLLGYGDNTQLSMTGLDEEITLITLPLPAGSSLLEPLLARLPDDLPVLTPPQLARAAEALQRPISIFTSSDRLLHSATYAGDLAQFDLDLGDSTRAKRHLLDTWQSFAKAPQWRAARWATGIAIAAQLIGLNIWAFKEDRSIAQRQQQATQVLQTTFPNVPVIVDAPVQMQRELELLRNNSGALSANDLEALLTASATISNMSNAKSLQYQDKQLRIAGIELNADALSDAQQSLEASGYQLHRAGPELVLSVKARP